MNYWNLFDERHCFISSFIHPFIHPFPGCYKDKQLYNTYTMAVHVTTIFLVNLSIIYRVYYYYYYYSLQCFLLSGSTYT